MKFSYKYSNKWVIPPYNYDSIYFPAENKHMLKIKIMSFTTFLVSGSIPRGPMNIERDLKNGIRQWKERKEVDYCIV